ncbi:YbaB/EbfC family nucleoid-associated protein [Dactylosporangium sp. AC04546]|uniref:YbaB/EbfC family nucleoid-associated protein n=1 Tax=Dactylosporangium sp. AC04546 TaxID=2862460 RepID=UPI001EDE3FC0|nr:YbaB/EbfC family nucleoid-associated protein [Dactylosporangium sp. AC04546]WVK78822.1 YbaB/EbfC family nucleoid-associated protein [Dactylosporangium sp. AC04546]
MTNEFDELRGLLEREGRGANPAAFRRMSEAAAALHQRLTHEMRQTVDATDPTGTVRATVRLDGRVESMYVSPHALRQFDAAGLGRACVAALDAARRAGAETLAGRLADGLGLRPDEHSPADLARLDRIADY